MPIGTTAAILAATMGGLGAASGALSNRSKTSTSTSTSTPTLSPELQPLQDDLVGRIMTRLQNPESGNIAGLRTKGLDSVNKAYAANPQHIVESLASRGFANSGQTGDALIKNEIGRAGSLTDVEQYIADMVNGNEQSTMGLAANVLSAGRGSSTTSSQTLPGNAGAGALQGGMNGIISGILLKSLLKG